jgi:sec-independent protein translocase protein TatA
MFRNPLVDALVVLVIVLLIFGPKRLPELGRSLGQGMREFKDSITGKSDDDERTAITETSADSEKTAGASAATVTPAREPADTGSERTS